jgi:hypothetical protein
VPGDLGKDSFILKENYLAGSTQEGHFFGNLILKSRNRLINRKRILIIILLLIFLLLFLLLLFLILNRRFQKNLQNGFYAWPAANGKALRRPKVQAGARVLHRADAVFFPHLRPSWGKINR